ncbi:MAG: reverse transcriptase/maturase family protein [Patescibacteria group bacterium]
MEDNLFSLSESLHAKTYKHSTYTPFYVQDPKLRHIHKACVRDRVVHQAVFRVLYPIFDKSFIFDSYSCRINKGAHKAVNRLKMFAKKLSHNNRRDIFALKCDIKKFFDSIDQHSLISFIRKKIDDKNTLWLVELIIGSFEKNREKGLPLGNVTSQLFANVYLNELDQFIKHKLKAKHYLRYCDDFIILGENKNYLRSIISKIKEFLAENLSLELHEHKIEIRKYSHGIDFLGYVVLPHYRVLRTKTKRRILRKIANRKREFDLGVLSGESLTQSVNSYFGVLKHCQGYKIRRRIEEITN